MYAGYYIVMDFSSLGTGLAKNGRHRLEIGFRGFSRNNFSCGEHQPLAQPLIPQKVRGRRSQPGPVALSHQDGVDSAFHDFRNSSCGRRHHGDARCHGFEQDVWAAFTQGRQNKHVGDAVVGARSCCWPASTTSWVRSKRRQSFSIRGRSGPSPTSTRRKGSGRQVRELRKCANQIGVAFFPRKPADTEKHASTVKGPSWRRNRVCSFCETGANGRTGMCCT